jgi:hypothetical protein
MILLIARIAISFSDSRNGKNGGSNFSSGSNSSSGSSDGISGSSGSNGRSRSHTVKLLLTITLDAEQGNAFNKF